MKVLNLIQGSPEWKAHRATAYNASDAPAMLGISKYKSRNDLIKERATGIVPEVDDATQRLFNNGHRFEALARPLAEEIIGEELSPITGTAEEYSASFDGITFDGSVIFEHKTMNANLREDLFSGATLDEQYRVQMEHQLMVSGAKKCLFMATAWDKDDKLVEEMHCWYMPDPELRKRIGMGWIQFKADVAAYVPSEVIDVPQADAIKSLPAVVIQVSGTLTNCNLDDVTPKFDTFLAKAEEGKTSIDIHNGTAIAKFSREAAADCKLTAKAVVSQMATVSDAVNTLELYAKKFDAMGLAYEKEVDRLKEIEKVAALNKAKDEYAAHIDGLQAEVFPFKLLVPVVDFAAAIKGLKTVESKNNALNVALANGKIAADQIAKDVRAKLAWQDKATEGYGYLFGDLSTLIANNGMEAFQAIVNGRIAKHKADEAAKEEATRLRIQAEEEAKAQAKAKAEQDAAIRAQALAEANKAPTKQVGDAIEAAADAKIESKVNLAAQYMRDNTPPSPTASVTPITKPSRPSDDAIISALAVHFRAHEMQVISWMLEMDLVAASTRASKEFA